MLHWLHSWPSNTEKELKLPSERYIPPSKDQIRKWDEEREAKEKFHAQRSELIEAALRKLKKDELIELLMRPSRMTNCLFIATGRLQCHKRTVLASFAAVPWKE